MKNKMVCMSMGVLLAVLSGCARDRTIEDYRADQQRQVEAQINAAQGDYRGMFVAEDGNNTPIGGLTIHVEPDTVASNAGNAPEIEQVSVVKLTVMLDDGTSTMSMTFNNGSFDPGAQQFTASNTVTNRGTANLKGTFDGNTLTGNLEVDGYPDRGGSFTLSKNAPGAAVKNMRTRAGSEKQFLFNSFIANTSLPGSVLAPSTNANGQAVPVQLTMVILKQPSVQDQDFMDVLTPYRTVDVSVFKHWKDANGTVHNNGGVFANSTWDIRQGTLVGTYNVAATGTTPSINLKLTCNQVSSSGLNGWNCQEQSLLQSAGVLFNETFLPAASMGGLQ